MKNSSVIPPLRIVFVMWLMYTIETYLGVDFGFLGILPMTLKGTIGIFTAPLIHGNLTHLISNTAPLLFLGAAVYFFYNKIASRVFFQCYFFTNILVWFFGRQFYHVGASGLIYGLAFFLISFGIFRRDLRSIMISLVIIIFYGGLVYGLSPANSNISWESHLFGAIVGLSTAFTLRNSRHVEG
ncbi:MAG: rhomboid family intramembrane serine protease [Cyclobacteriaceae bacterium]